MLVFILTLITTTLCLQRESFSSACKLIDDPIKMLQCEIEFLLKSNKQIQVSVEEMEKSDAIQNELLLKMDKTRAGLSTRCEPNVCGPCACFTDYQLKKNYYCNCEHLEPMRDCLAFRNAGYNISGLYLIDMNHNKRVEVFCDQETDSGGWTVILRRMNGHTNFIRDWISYKEGFGYPQREFYLGNENIYLLTYQAEYLGGSELRFDMEYWSNEKIYAQYEKFAIENEDQKYKVFVDDYSGNAGDSFGYHNNQMFTTFDSDNDQDSSNCAKGRGGWWYKQCFLSLLTGQYRLSGETVPSWKGIIWYDHTGKDKSLKFADMKVRRQG